MFDKNKIMHAFNRAAPTYDQAANIQRIVGIDLLKTITTNPKIIVDLGCGTGFLTQQLALRFPKATVIGIDFAENMLKQAQQNIRQKNICWVCADVDQLPLSSNYCELAVANLMMQWSCNHRTSFREMLRIVQPSAPLLFTTLGAGCLHELNTAWQKVDIHPHVHHFCSQAEWLNAITPLTDEKILLTQKSYTVHYAKVIALMHDLKNIGASNQHRNRSCGLSTKSKLQAVIEAYEPFRTKEAALPATYEIYFGTITK